ncbi:Serine/threonine-protein kinase PknB [Novipirellula galeiformis]|uniref:Serine/threonine-protein kinase PknB n=1 Tax=Novipirellula galeiformis TaxID=2528004 RepID=A0A5C6CID9_9BACT|nr:serine/threonine-protein kinase [Novipirellula galeiformis]TWU23254.1 Serine/threonine-protein kinase PknB [Novipirellula galeiformis]
MNKGSERAIFLQAIEEESLVDREAYLNSACRDDPQLRASVEALLAAHDEPRNMLDYPIASNADLTTSISTLSTANVQHVGMTIGPYQLMEQIGEGGFGLVFVAMQTHPMRRKVALKIVKPGMGSKEVIARFEAERQAVAMMDHPNIARVFDAGVTDDARPYFVMELVRGVPITEFCDRHGLDLRDRLKVFVDVCSAVHHAHQKGVIHRDIKPSNVMVTLHDDRPVAKVIDFGVAKAIGQSLTDKTIYTRFFSMIGTPLYMSPEQAEMSGLDVDTRSDIYSLGVLLYELLVGATPFDRERLDSAGYDELRRIIREEEPPKPSSRLSTLGGDPTTIAATRQTSPIRLSTSIQGDLDWIVMKAIEKNRNRRYESAAAMADDVNRHLLQQPIEARPPTLVYQLSKFASRNRVALATVSIVALALIGGTGVSLWQMKAAMNERDQKELALREIEQFANHVTLANSLIASAQTHAIAGNLEMASADYDSAVAQQPSYYLPWVARGQFHTRTQQWQEAADDFSRAISLGAPVDTPQWWGVGALLRMTNHDEAFRQLSQQLEQRINSGQPIRDWEFVRNCVAGPSQLSPESLTKLKTLAGQWLQQQRFGQRGHRPPPNRLGRDQDVHPLPPAVSNYIFGLICLRAGDFEEAITYLEESAQDPRWPSVGLTYAPLALCFNATNRHDKASQFLQRAQESVEQMNETFQESEVQHLPWFDLVEVEVFYSEAKMRIPNSDDRVP